MRDSSAILQSFYNFVSPSRYAWLSRIEDSMAVGNTAAAYLSSPAPAMGCVTGPVGVKVRDGSGGDSIVTNYVSFYNLYLNWQTGTFSTSDSITLDALAALCPAHDSAVIYQARTLLHMVTGTILVYDDNCSGGDIPDYQGGGGGGERKAPTEIIEQQYNLRPNPSDGIIYLQQKTADNNPVDIVVYNSIGAKVYATNKAFEVGRSSMNLKWLAAGLYRIVIQDGNGNNFTLKFVKQ